MWYISYDGSFFTLRTCEPVSEKLLWQLEETFPAGRLVLDKTMVYDKINEKINALEMMYEQTEEGMRNAETEKARNSMEAKLNAIRYKIDELKRQSELIKAQIESKNNNKNMN